MIGGKILSDKFFQLIVKVSGDDCCIFTIQKNRFFAGKQTLQRFPDFLRVYTKAKGKSAQIDAGKTGSLHDYRNSFRQRSALQYIQIGNNFFVLSFMLQGQRINNLAAANRCYRRITAQDKAVTGDNHIFIDQNQLSKDFLSRCKLIFIQ